MSDTVVVTESGGVNVVSVGIQGPPGSSFGNFIGGYSVIVDNLINGDVLSFDTSGSKWKNKRAVELTDGGNF
jgi:hypothetical protein